MSAARETVREMLMASLAEVTGERVIVGAEERAQLRAARKARRIYFKTIAHQVGRSRRTVISWERGERAPSCAGYLAWRAAVLGDGR